jgi:hypothetical protein
MIVSCKKEYPTQVQTGNMIGFVTLYDENGILIQDKSGVSISVSGSKSYNVITSANGKFEIDNVPSGTYNLIFTKDSFGTTKRIGTGFVGGSNPVYISQILSKPTSTIVKLISLSVDTNKLVHVTFQLNYNGSTGNVRFYFGTSDSVSYTNYDYTVLDGFSGNKISGNRTITLSNTPSFPSGTQVYFIAYGSPSYSSSYTDIVTGKTIYPSLNSSESQIMSVMFP